MRTYPVFLNLEGRKAVVVGGGPVGQQKVRGLLEAGAGVHLVAPEATEELRQLAGEGCLRWSARPYAPADLEGAALAIAATDDPALQERVAADARARGIWVNVVDVTPLCDFIAPAVLRRGALQVAVSTGGASPALAAFVRRKLEAALGPEYGELAALLQEWRPALLRLHKARRETLWECLISDEFLAMIRTEGRERAAERLKEWLDGDPAI